MSKLFGTNGIRGVVDSEIDHKFAFSLGCALAKVFGKGRIMLGWDGRDSSPMLAEGVAAGILSQGLDIIDLGLTTTPMLQFLVKSQAAKGGVMVTASHNPPQYNGFKVIDSDGVEIPSQKEEQVEKAFRSKKKWKFDPNPGSRTNPSGLDGTYLDALRSHLRNIRRKLEDITVVVDAGNGVAALTTPLALSTLGCRVVTINDNIDGLFPGRPSEPRPDSLSALSQTVRDEGADFGVAHDGDGDRALFADENGTVHWGDRTFALIVDDILQTTRGGTIVTPINSSMAVSDVAKKRGGKLVVTKVGSIFVSRKMIEIKALLGGEENGGIFYGPHHPVRDGSMATLLVLRAIAHTSLSLSRLLRRLPTYSMAKQKFDCRDHSRKAATMARLKKMLKPQISSQMDGLKVEIDGKGWILVRPSGTEPYIRLYAEGRTDKDLSGILEEFTPLVETALKK